MLDVVPRFMLVSGTMKRLLFPIILLALLPAAKASVIAYMATGSENFGTVDLTTGAYTHIGSMGHRLAGLGVSGSNIYGGVFGGNTLYQVNTGTGALTPVGTTTISYDAFGSTLTSMYAIDTSFNLYSVSTAGATMLIGPTGVSLGSLWGMSDNSATLYLSNGTNLYTVNTASGHATLVGGLTGAKRSARCCFLVAHCTAASTHPHLPLTRSTSVPGRPLFSTISIQPATVISGDSRPGQASSGPSRNQTVRGCC
jgi:hypothetical protein